MWSAVLQRAQVTVSAYDRCQRRATLLVGRIAQRQPAAGIEGRPGLEGKAAGQTRGSTGREQRGLDRQGAGSAHRVDERCCAIPAAEQQQPRSQRFAQGGDGALQAVAAAVQPDAGQVKADGAAVTAEVQVDRQIRGNGVDVGAAPATIADPVDDGVLPLEGDVA